MGDIQRQRQAVPAYFHPDDAAEDWARLATATCVGLVVANISNGPGIVREERWALAFDSVRAAVVGYVDIGYLGFTGLHTRRGSTLIDDWLEQILHDVATWYRLYGDRVTGIFFDQVAESDDGASIAPVLRRLREHVRQHDPNAVTVLNPGDAVPAAFADLSDILVTFEGPSDAYLVEGTDTGFEPLSWQPGSGQTICHMIHNTSNPAKAAEVIALSRKRGAGLLYVTDGCGENPYSSLPSEEIWAIAELREDSGRSARKGRRRLLWRKENRRQLPAYKPAGSLAESTMISNPSLARTPQAIEASADFEVPSSYRRVFLASRGRNVPRWWTGSSPQIAADWLIENDRLYTYAGSGTDWTWTPSGQVPFEVDGSKVRWCLDPDRIEAGDDTEAVFHVTAPGHREYSEVAVGCRPACYASSEASRA
jgi:hypothetical protein